MSVAAKQDFLDRLKASISCLPLQDQADILNDYEEHFRIGLENGKTEAEIAGSVRISSVSIPLPSLCCH